MQREREKEVRAKSLTFPGFRVEDIYYNKFFKEPYVNYHIYAQYFHPTTLLERVRDVTFFRRPRTLFKGFSVPDWAQSQNSTGYDIDIHSRQAWNNAMNDMRSEWTPVQFEGQRLDPNPLNAFRIENIGGGFSSRLFYNEVPQTRWIRDGGHTDNADKQLYSFKWADQDEHIALGYDTTTPEGRAAFEAEWDAQVQMTPELLSNDDLIYPHEQTAQVSQEAHFQRVWQHYREHQLRARIGYLEQQGIVSDEDGNDARSFLNSHGNSAVDIFILSQRGRLSEFANDSGFQALNRIFEHLGFNEIELTTTTSMPFDQQFWLQVDGLFDLSEDKLREELGTFITDARDRAKVEAILENQTTGISSEENRQISQ